MSKATEFAEYAQQLAHSLSGVGGSAKNRHNIATDNVANLTGKNGWLGVCDDMPLLSHSFKLPWLDIFGFYPSTVENRFFNLIAWADGSEVAAGNPRNGIVSDCCAPRAPVNWGGCKLKIEGWNHLGRQGGTICLRDHVQKCVTEPRFRLDGTQITTPFEWRAYLAMEGIMGDVQSQAVFGDGLLPGQTDGLQNLIKTGYIDSMGQPCPWADSFVIDWNSGCQSAPTSTWSDGRGTVPIAANVSLITVLRNIAQFTLKRIANSPSLNGQTIRPGDRYIMGSFSTIQTLLDCMVCYKFCPSGCNEQMLMTSEARGYYETLLGGLLGGGTIQLGGETIPLIVGPDTLGSDLYFITRAVGGRRLNYGEFLDYRYAVSASGAKFNELVAVTDEGRFAMYESSELACVTSTVDHSMRLVFEAPYLCARISNVISNTPGGAISWTPGLPGYIGGPLPLTPSTPNSEVC